jgi:hypothetical protein
MTSLALAIENWQVGIGDAAVTEPHSTELAP